jgi:transposase
MKRFVEGKDRRQTTLLPDCVDDYVAEENPVRAIEAFADALDLAALGFEGVVPETTGRPAYHPATLLKIYLYGYLNRIQWFCQVSRQMLVGQQFSAHVAEVDPNFIAPPGRYA